MHITWARGRLKCNKAQQNTENVHQGRAFLVAFLSMNSNFQSTFTKLNILKTSSLKSWWLRSSKPTSLTEQRLFYLKQLVIYFKYFSDCLCAWDLTFFMDRKPIPRAAKHISSLSLQRHCIVHIILYVLHWFCHRQ